MKIEERAEKAFEEYKGVNECDYFTDGYQQGAQDQLANDTKWITENVGVDAAVDLLVAMEGEV